MGRGGFEVWAWGGGRWMGKEWMGRGRCDGEEVVREGWIGGVSFDELDIFAFVDWGSIFESQVLLKKREAGEKRGCADMVR